MDKITLNREEQIRWAARMGELRARAIGTYRDMVNHQPFRYMTKKDASAYVERTSLVGQVARAWHDRWKYKISNHWNQ